MGDVVTGKAQPDETVRLEWFVEASDQRWTALGGGVARRVRLDLPEMMMVEVAFEAGAVGALHSHPHVQCSYIREGAFDVTIGGTTTRLTEGGAFIAPPNVVHGVRAVEAGLLIDVFAPRRDDFVGARDGTAKAGPSATERGTNAARRDRAAAGRAAQPANRQGAPASGRAR